jgi:hypothetical protein
MTTKIKTKNLKYCHVNKDGSLLLGYSEIHKISGKEIQWNETIIKAETSFSVYMDNKEYNYRSIFLSDYIVPLINDIMKIEAYPKNSGKDCPYLLTSIYIVLKNGAKIPFHKFTENGKEYRTHECEFLY